MLGVQVAVSQGLQRKETDGDALAGMGDRNGRTMAKEVMTVNAGMLSARANYGVGLKNEMGSTGAFAIEANMPLAKRSLASIGAGATIADSRNMQYEFGVSSSQPAERQALIDAGDARLREGDGTTYTPSAGLKQTMVSAGLGYGMTERTRLMLFAQGTRLSNEATASTVVRRRDGVTGGMAVVWGF